MRSLLQYLYDLVVHNNNQFLQGGLVLGALTAIAAYARRLPMQAIRYIRSRFIITLDITNEDPAFYWLAAWLSMLPYARRARNLSVTTYRDHYGNVRSVPGANDSTPQVATSERRQQAPDIILTPAPGNHFFFYKRRPVWLTRTRESGSKGEDRLFSVFNKESFQIRMIGRRQQVARELIEEARQLAVVERERKTDVYVVSRYDGFQRVDSCDPRPLSSVFLPDNHVENICDDVKEFLTARAWYVARGIPYRRGYLLHGIPGSGKTSLIKALCGELRIDLYIVNLAGGGLSDRELMFALARVPAGAALLFEDMDAAFTERSKTKEGDSPQLTFSGLLNALDGAASHEGWIVFMTSNHKERLDPALIRSGRADYHLEFTHATSSQAMRMFNAFYPNDERGTDFGVAITSHSVSMADVQKVLLDHKHSAADALTAVERKVVRAAA